ncbi:MAG: hypothetical protein H7Z72_10720 [Bacteroidetes bacterium]|nr:hypothetical protein [Fibrella sp.]
MPTPTIAAFYKNLAKGDVVTLALSDADLMDWAEAEGATPTRYNELVRG